jgi:uncharacterized RDD family membrane protein YckC
VNTISAGNRRPSCGILRRLAAVTYDILLLLAVLFITTLVMNITLGPEFVQSSKMLLRSSLLLCCYLYFVWHWVRGRQTLGMLAWRLVLLRADGSMLSWRTASYRFLLALVSIAFFGCGWLWALFDPMRHALYDRCAGTVLAPPAAGVTKQRP